MVLKKALLGLIRIDPATQCWISRYSHVYISSRARQPLKLHCRIASWEIHRGDIPRDAQGRKFLIVSNCLTKNCVNPIHLRARPSKAAIGPTRHMAQEIDDRYFRGGISQRKLAEEYNLGLNTIKRIVHHKDKYADLPAPKGHYYVFTWEEAARLKHVYKQGKPILGLLVDKYEEKPGVIHNLVREPGIDYAQLPKRRASWAE